MIQENTPLPYLVEFSTGTPTGVFSYSLIDGEGNPVDGITNVEITPSNGMLSVMITIPATANQLTKPLFERRTLTWVYPTSNGIMSGSYSYQIQKAVPFPCTPEGVRLKLGISPDEIPDSSIDLLSAYLQFDELFVDGISAYINTGDSLALKITNAIEAVAALNLLPSLQLAIAKRLTSGTNEYERWAKVDWDIIRGTLESIVYNTTVLIDPQQVYVGSAIFTLAVRSPDAFTGA